jgi:hypothetical protein
VTSSTPGSPATADFDHHSPDMPDHNWAVLAELRSRCPVAYTEAHGGFRLISGHDEVQKAARDIPLSRRFTRTTRRGTHDRKA